MTDLWTFPYWEPFIHQTMLLVLTVLLVRPALHDQDTTSFSDRAFLTGTIFGLSCLLVEFQAAGSSGALAFDFRTVLLNLCGLFFGIYSTIIATVIALAADTILSPDSLSNTHYKLILAGAWGAGWHHLKHLDTRRISNGDLLLVSLTLQGMLTLLTLTISTDPSKATPPQMVLLIGLLRSGVEIALGLILRHEKKSVQTELALEEYKEASALSNRIIKSGHWSYNTVNGQFYCSAELMEALQFGGQKPPTSLQGLISLIDSHQEATLTGAFNTALSGARPSDTEITVQSADGEQRQYHVSVSPIRHGDEDVVEIIGVMQDITHFRKLEANLDASIASYRDMFWQSPIPMWIYHRRNYAFLAVNAAAEHRFGLSEALRDKLTRWDLAPSDSSSHPDDVHSTVRAPDGRMIEVDIRRQNLEFEGEDATIEVITDLTEERRLALSLEAEKEKFRAVSEQSMFGVYIIRKDVFDYTNPALESILGYRSGELIGKPVTSVVAPSDQETVADNIRQRNEGTINESRYRFVCRRKDGSEITASVHGIRRVIQGEVLIIGVLQDVSHEVQSERTIADHARALENALTGAVATVARMVELRDPYTAGHESRVGELSADIAREMGFDEPFQACMRFCGALHDVGKITVPAELLAKPSRLTQTEFDLIRDHAETGYQILRHVEFPWPVAQVARQHHERLDGSGYPQGLAGEEIILEARILMVADVVESMSAHRPYRAALGTERALAEIEENAGILYDEAAVNACLRLFRDKGYRLPE